MRLLIKRILVEGLEFSIIFIAIALVGCTSADKKETIEIVASEEICHTTPNRAQLAEKDTVASNSNGATPQNLKNAVDGMIFIEGGTFQMGSTNGMPHESPVHEAAIKSFYLDATETTVAEFAKFVEETGYVTEAEKFGNSGVFDTNEKQWTMRTQANWRHPDGGDSETKPNEPVTQVSWNDANAFAKWAGKRLPTEAEWEYAARGNLRNKEYSWGDEQKPDGNLMANYWQGEFPFENRIEDGYEKRAPVKTFAANGYGLYDMAGNVWEWCSDWYAADYYETAPKENPKGAASGEERVMRGGSWMCAENFCTNYRVAGRSHSSPETGLNNVGFRLARDAETKAAR